MKIINYVLNRELEVFVVKEACEKLFDEVRFEEICEQNHRDKSWVRLLSRTPKCRYSKLGEKDLDFLLEGYVASILDSLIWGHSFRVQARVNQLTNEGDYEILCHIELLRG